MRLDNFRNDIQYYYCTFIKYRDFKIINLNVWEGGGGYSYEIIQILDQITEGLESEINLEVEKRLLRISQECKIRLTQSLSFDEEGRGLWNNSNFGPNHLRFGKWK